MTEHAAVIFVFFFLAEYASIVLMCLLISILFLGGYNFDFSIISSLAVFVNNIYDLILEYLAPSYTEHESIDITRFKQYQEELKKKSQVSLQFLKLRSPMIGPLSPCIFHCMLP